MKGRDHRSKPLELRFVLHNEFRHSHTIRASQIRDGKWLAEGEFSVTNLGNLDRIRHDQVLHNL